MSLVETRPQYLLEFPRIDVKSGLPPQLSSALVVRGYCLNGALKTP